ncbi:MAG: class I SAM-dependent methyltransferase [Candidatus Doudnabacteria bacterium]|nr:class I SAM-dependent methyltransferase [Candidatus Doudnabacteria bacterium]
MQKKWKDEEEDARSLGFKQKYFSQLSGKVLEIGPGAGTNFKYFPKEIHWIGIEPNEVINQELIKEAQRQGLTNIEIKNSQAEQLPLESDSCDAVIATFVLCSVLDQKKVLAEIFRVLKPGGRYLFIEHVAAPRGSLLRLYQNAANPFHRLYAGNCNINRETAKYIQATGFKNVSITEGKEKLFLLPWPHIWGVAEK